MLIVMLAMLLGSAPRALAESGDDDPSAPVPPSVNKGHLGTYRVEQPDGNAYWVYVPSTYSDDHPAGLHLFFHGQNGQNWAQYFDSWTGPFLTTYNLIGINMQYMDGDNGRDTPGKTAAARRAVAQVIADYKILVGRGTISSFSGGGLPHALWASAAFKNRGTDWPFCQTTLYSSNYRMSVTGGCPMSWFVSVGTDEWALATLGVDGFHRVGELYQDVERGGCPDIQFMILKSKGHWVDPREVAASAAEFGRADLAFAPFVYTADYPEQELRGIVHACDALDLGRASSAISSLKKRTTLPAALAAKLAALSQLVDDRLQHLAAMATQLAAQDPPLATYYLQIYRQEARGTPTEKVIRQAITSCSHDAHYQSGMDAYGAFIELFPNLLGGDGASPAPVPDKVADLSEIVKHLNPSSQTGMMAANLLALAP